MKKKILAIVLILLMIPSIIVAKEAIPSPQILTIDSVETDLRGYNIGGYNYYKLRDLAYYLKDFGFDFSLWGDSKEIKVNLDESYESQGHEKYRPVERKTPLAKTMKINVIENGITSSEIVRVYNIDGYNYFRLRDVGRLLGFDVDYDKEANIAMINTELAYVERDEKVLAKENIMETYNYPDRVILGNERILTEYVDLIRGKNIGLITNQTGIDGQGLRTVEKLYNSPETSLVALYSPEHGLDGKAKAGEWVESYTDHEFNLPVYSLYGKTRKPTSKMLAGIDVLLFDIQDIGSRTYTYISCMNYAMRAAAENNIPIIILDRPNPIGDKVEGYMLQDKYQTYVGVDNMPMSHGMTIGELAQYFNREIGVDLTVVPMLNYKRDMIWQETGLIFPQTSPNIPYLEAAFNYMATGSVGGTGAIQSSYFSWVGKPGINSNELANRLNSTPLLEGVNFIAEPRGKNGGVRIEVSDYKSYNPARVGYYILATINNMSPVKVPKEVNGVIPMFEKIQGSDVMGDRLAKQWTGEQIIADYQKDIEDFKNIRQAYLIYD